MQMSICSQCVDITVRPILKESPPHSVEQKVESWISLPCAAAGSPQPSVHWYRNAVPINNTDRSVQDSLQLLVVCDVQVWPNQKSVGFWPLSLRHYSLHCTCVAFKHTVWLLCLL